MQDVAIVRAWQTEHPLSELTHLTIVSAFLQNMGVLNHSCIHMQSLHSNMPSKTEHDPLTEPPASSKADHDLLLMQGNRTGSCCRWSRTSPPSWSGVKRLIPNF